MRVSYNKLWKLLIDKNMKKGELRDAIGASKSTFAKLGKNENVTLPVLLSICECLNCDFGDIMEALPDEVNVECKSANNMNENILIVDDEKEIADLIEVYLKNDGNTVHKFYNGTDALKCIESQNLDLVILDVMLPDVDGFRICQKIREQYFYPIIMLTAKVEDTDKIMGLTIGADDYITKPFNPLEVVARVKTQLRRYVRYNQPINKQALENIEYDIRGLSINKNNHKCSLFGKELQLTPIEFSILWYLCDHQGKVVSSEELFEAVWKEKYLDNNNTVMAHIGRLREKMKEPAKKPKFIKTVWGVGYTIE